MFVPTLESINQLEDQYRVMLDAMKHYRDSGACPEADEEQLDSFIAQWDTVTQGFDSLLSIIMNMDNVEGVMQFVGQIMEQFNNQSTEE